MASPTPYVVTAHEDNTVTVEIAGALTHSRIAAIAQRIDCSGRITIDLSRATGSYSTSIAACIRLAAASGKPVTVVGCGQRFATTVAQMRLSHLILVVV